MQLEVRNSPLHGFRFSLHVSLWFLRQVLLTIYAVLCFVYADVITSYVWEFKAVRIAVRILKVLCEVLLTELLALFRQPVQSNERSDTPQVGDRGGPHPTQHSSFPDPEPARRGLYDPQLQWLKEPACRGLRASLFSLS